MVTVSVPKSARAASPARLKRYRRSGKPFDLEQDTLGPDQFIVAYSTYADGSVLPSDVHATVRDASDTSWFDRARYSSFAFEPAESDRRFVVLDGRWAKYEHKPSWRAPSEERNAMHEAWLDDGHKIPGPRSWVDLPEGGTCLESGEYGLMRARTREAALRSAARSNRLAFQKMGRPGILTNWAIVVELGPVVETESRGRASFETYELSPTGIGTATRNLARPIRLCRPIGEELLQYAIEGEAVNGHAIDEPWPADSSLWHWEGEDFRDGTHANNCVPYSIYVVETPDGWQPDMTWASKVPGDAPRIEVRHFDTSYKAIDAVVAFNKAELASPSGRWAVIAGRGKLRLPKQRRTTPVVAETACAVELAVVS